MQPPPLATQFHSIIAGIICAAAFRAARQYDRVATLALKANRDNVTDYQEFKLRAGTMRQLGLRALAARAA